MKNKNSNEMWNMVQSMGWGTSYDYKQISIRLHQRYLPKKINEIFNFCLDKVNALYNVIKEYNSENSEKISLGGDDSINDLLWHIVGLGENIYNEYLFEPTKLASRYKSGLYRESFAYCFHKPNSKPEPVSIPVNGTTCWCCGAPSEQPTQAQMVLALHNKLHQLPRVNVIKIAMEIIEDLPEGILDSYYIKHILKKVS